MWYLNMNAVVAIVGMVAAMMLTRRWTQNKRVLLLVFNLGFLGVYSQKLLVFYLAYTALNYVCFIFLSRTVKLRRLWFYLLIAGNVAGVSLIRLFGMGTFHHPLFDAVITVGLIYNVLKVIDALYFAYFVGKDVHSSALDYFNFVLFLPTFTSGPILKFRDFMAETKQPYKVDSATVEASVKRIILGMFKKIVLATWLMALFNKVLLTNELHTHESLFLMICFYIYLYFDFSGYSDIAVGFGRLFGYNIPENFKKPFLSPSLTQYWRNWHSTMADWFRDHVFMLVSRKNPSKWVAAGLSMIIMLLIGLWHGFNWLYVAWGLYHGIFIALESTLGKSTVNRKKVSRAHFYARCLLTQTIVLMGVLVYAYTLPNGLETVTRIYRGLLHLPGF